MSVLAFPLCPRVRVDQWPVAHKTDSKWHWWAVLFSVRFNCTRPEIVQCGVECHLARVSSPSAVSLPSGLTSVPRDLPVGLVWLLLVRHLFSALILCYLMHFSLFVLFPYTESLVVALSDAISTHIQLHNRSSLLMCHFSPPNRDSTTNLKRSPIAF